jgi:hypothetical protein
MACIQKLLKYMSIDKTYWLNLHFRDDKFPDILCPTCRKGMLKIETNFISRDTRRSRELKNADYFDETDYEEKFTGFLKCSNPACEETVVVSGSKFAEPDEVVFDDDGEYLGQPWYTHYRPEYFTPAIEIFPLKKEYPKSVNAILRNSFTLFFLDVEACANKIRITIETLLDELGTKRTFINRQNKREYYKLHKRIEDYKNTNGEIGELMLSIKWIGNFGSHSGELKKDDIIDAYTFMEVILDKLYDDGMEKIKRLAKTINKTKKPASKIKVKKKSKK